MEKQFIFRELDYYNLGVVDYKEAWDMQKEALALRVNGQINDRFYLLEHPHTYTLGKVADKNNLIGNPEYLKDNNISVYEIDRGGDITYHGPGQIVGYPIIDLNGWRPDTHLYLRTLEEIIMMTLEDYGVFSHRIEGLTGVWIENRKIAAIGVKISRWVTMHGFAFNINTDLSLFSGIIPCGIRNKTVTSLQEELGCEISLGEVKEKIVNNFSKAFMYTKINNIDI